MSFFQREKGGRRGGKCLCVISLFITIELRFPARGENIRRGEKRKTGKRYPKKKKKGRG